MALHFKPLMLLSLLVVSLFSLLSQMQLHVSGRNVRMNHSVNQKDSLSEERKRAKHQAILKQFDASNCTHNSKRRIVITFGVCLSPQAQLEQTTPSGHSHQRKPFDVAAVLATALWKGLDSSLQVAVVLAHPYNAQDALPDHVLAMVHQIKAAGGIPWLYSTHSYANPNDSCIRAAQMGRMFVFEAAGMLHDDDIMVTSDADIFPVHAQQLLRPIQQCSHVRLWMSQYPNAVPVNETIPMGFIGMSVRDWKEAWRRTQNMTLHKALESSQTMDDAWGLDQLLGTAAILNSGLCDFPRNYQPIETLDQLGLITTTAHDIETRDSTHCAKGPQPAACTLPFSMRLPNSRQDWSCHFAHFFPWATRNSMMGAYRDISKLHTGRSFQSMETLLLTS